ncbi:hypothetical protein CLOM_g12065 [Closterium sp. NIES-68]|nr:hypothetical protein CLOM_g12065 [Closterium sp. NIES-68]
MGDEHHHDASSLTARGGEGGVAKESFALTVKNNFESLHQRGFAPNDAAALALKIAMGKAELLAAISKARASRAAKASRAAQDSSHVAELIPKVLSSADAVSLVFLAMPEGLSKGNLLGIDSATVKLFYDGVANLGDEVAAAVVRASDRLLSELSQAMPSVPSSTLAHHLPTPPRPSPPPALVTLPAPATAAATSTAAAGAVERGGGAASAGGRDDATATAPGTGTSTGPTPAATDSTGPDTAAPATAATPATGARDTASTAMDVDSPPAHAPSSLAAPPTGTPATETPAAASSAMDIATAATAAVTAGSGSVKRKVDSLAAAATGRGHHDDTEPSPAVMRSLLFLLDSPFLMDPEHHPLYRRLCKLLLDLPPLARQQLVSTLASYEREHLQQLVETAQHVITIQLYESQRLVETVRLATRVLGIFFAANQRGHQLPHSAFYNDAINSDEFVDLEQDYTKWKHRDRYLDPFTLCEHPYILEAASKAAVLQVESRIEMSHRFHDALLGMALRGLTGAHMSNPFCVLIVRRDHIVEDAILQVQQHAGDLKKPLKVKFVGEEGVDEGGVQKEFFQLIIRDILDAKFGMFTYNEVTRSFWFSASPIDMPLEFELIGTVLGLAIYNAHILDMRFPLVVYKKLLGKKTGLEDLAGVDPDLHRGLKGLLAFQGNVEEVYSWSFEASYTDVFGSPATVPLKEGGENLPVTNSNREEFVDLLVDFHLNKLVERQFGPFSHGFLRLCGGAVLRMFQADELELMVCGSPVFDFEELERNARYEDGYSKESPVIKNFWKVVHGLQDAEKRSLLAFVTGCDRAPIKGLASLPFVISRAGPDSDRLPTAHTCFNHLLLPEYSNFDKLHSRLLTAINNSQGFGLM